MQVELDIQHHLGQAKQNGGSTKPANHSKGKLNIHKIDTSNIGKSIIEILGDRSELIRPRPRVSDTV